MKILVIGINYSPEIISTAVYTGGLAEWMVQRGHDVRVITAQPYYPDWKVFDGYPRLAYKTHQPSASLKVTHCPHYVPAKPSGIKRVLHHASFAASALPRALWHSLRQRPDVVLVVAPSIISAPVGWLSARLGGAKAWLHIQDFEVEAAFATGLLPATGRFADLARAFERWCLARFDLVSSISKPMLKKLSAKSVPDERIYEFRNWADLSRVTPMDAPFPLKEQLGITTQYVALYSGNIANKQGLEIIPEAARMMADRNDLTFAIFGAGPALEDLKFQAKGLKNIRFFPLQPKERLSELLSMADVHLLPQIAGAADLVLPSKLTNMLASGRPVIATADPGTALVEEIEGAGLATPPGDARALVNALGDLLENEQLRTKMGATARSRALECWDGDSILARLEERLMKLTNFVQPTPSAAQKSLKTKV